MDTRVLTFSNRRMADSAFRSGRSSLIAVGRRRSAWLARHTSPMPPSPIFSSSVYCPSTRARWTSRLSPKIVREASVPSATPTDNQHVAVKPFATPPPLAPPR
jgi:hypothetical protein